MDQSGHNIGPLIGHWLRIGPDLGTVAAVTVRIALPCDVVGRGDLRGRVKLGMSGQVEIITDRERLLKILVRRIRRTISLG